MIHYKSLQLGKKQDELFQGRSIDRKTGESYSYGIIADGHGSTSGFEVMRSIMQNHLDAILESENPHLVIQEQIEIIRNSYWSIFGENMRRIFEMSQAGSTFIRVKLYANRVECFSIGDSEVYVLKNDAIAYHNPVHNWANENERNRLLNRKDITVSTRPSVRYEIINPNTIKPVPSAQIRFDYNHLFVPSQSLGHNGITEFAPERCIIDYNEHTDSIKVVLGSDGLWDLFMPSHDEDYARLKTFNGEQLADLAEMRWKQMWNVYNGEDDIIQESYFEPGTYDDISVITICSK
jgi:serine/threonine protein phosphatase PrpC